MLYSPFVDYTMSGHAPYLMPDGGRWRAQSREPAAKERKAKAIRPKDDFFASVLRLRAQAQGALRTALQLGLRAHCGTGVPLCREFAGVAPGLIATAPFANLLAAGMLPFVASSAVGPVGANTWRRFSALPRNCAFDAQHRRPLHSAIAILLSSVCLRVARRLRG